MVELGERTYTLASPKIGRAKAWREKLVETIGRFAEIAHDLDLSAMNDISDLGPVIDMFRPLLAPFLVTLLDDIIELIVIFSDELEADRDYILAEATEAQIIDAIFEIYEVADPLALPARILNTLNPRPTLNSSG